MRRSITSAVVVLLAICPWMVSRTEVAAQVTNAINSGNWSDSLIWDAGEPTVFTPETRINGGLTVTLDQPGEVADQLDIGGNPLSGQSRTGNLQITGGDLSLNDSGAGPSFSPSIRLGVGAFDTGHLSISGGTVNVNGPAPSGFAEGDILVGDNGTGTMTMTGGTVNVADELFVGLFGTGTGTLNVSGGQLNILGRNLLLAFGSATDATFNLGGTGEVNVAGFVFSSFSGGASSVLTQNGGTMNIGSAFVLGREGNSTFTHSAGAINVVGGNGDFVVGDNFANNVYNVSGTAAVNTGNVLVGVFGESSAVVNQTGGTIAAGTIAGRSSFYSIGRDGVAQWNLSGGSVTGGTELTSLFLGDFDSSTGTMKVSGGAIDISGNLSVGGALASNAPPSPIGTEGQALDANGVLIVSGSLGTIDVGGDLLANPDDNTRVGGGGEHNDGTLLFEVLNNSGVSIIDAAGLADLTGAEIDVDILGGTFSAGATFDLITAQTISSDFIQVAEDMGAIDLSIIAGGNGQILRATLLSVVNGDFNDDGFYNCTDVDALVADIAAGNNTASFDLTGDGFVNGNDLNAWLSEAGGVNLGPGKAYLPGDATLSGSVDGSDFGVWNANKFTSVAAWCSGDFSANGVVDGSDFGIWNANKFTSSDGNQVVPEPAAWSAVVLLVGALLARVRLAR